jgi:hypothetical protein
VDVDGRSAAVFVRAVHTRPAPAGILRAGEPGRRVRAMIEA